MNPIIKLENVSYKYPDNDNLENRFALDKLNLEINEGEFVAILGHNGSGKSTAAKLLLRSHFRNDYKVIAENT